MIRIIAKSVYAIPDGSHAGTEYKTFDGDLDALEKWLISATTYECRSVVGIEVRAREAGQ